MSLLRLGTMLRERRGTTGVREASREIGISPATLTRIEAGRLPDIATFKLVCTWLKINPAEILDIPIEAAENSDTSTAVAAFHSRAPKTLPKGAADDLAQLILVAHAELARRKQRTRNDVSPWI
jgi:transcriptional regulator with XRE-family HTH domain